MLLDPEDEASLGLQNIRSHSLRHNVASRKTRTPSNAAARTSNLAS